MEAVPSTKFVSRPTVWVIIIVVGLVILACLIWLVRYTRRRRHRELLARRAIAAERAAAEANALDVPPGSILESPPIQIGHSNLPHGEVASGDLPEPSNEDTSATIPPQISLLPPRSAPQQLKMQMQMADDPDTTQQYVTSIRSLLPKPIWQELPTDATEARKRFRGTYTRLDHDYYSIADSPAFQAGPAAMTTVERSSPNLVLQQLVTDANGNIVGRSAGPGSLGSTWGSYWPHGDVLTSDRNARVDEMLATVIQDDILADTLFTHSSLEDR